MLFFAAFFFLLRYSDCLLFFFAFISCVLHLPISEILFILADFVCIIHSRKKNTLMVMKYSFGFKISRFIFFHNGFAQFLCIFNWFVHFCTSLFYFIIAYHISILLSFFIEKVSKFNHLTGHFPGPMTAAPISIFIKPITIPTKHRNITAVKFFHRVNMFKNFFFRASAVSRNLL